MGSAPETHTSGKDETEAAKLSDSTENWGLFFKIYRAVHMGKFEEAEHLLEDLKRQVGKSAVPILAKNHVIFFEGLVAAILAFRCTGRNHRRRLSTAQKKLKKLKAAGVEQDPTLWNKIYLLDAQIHACVRQCESALLYFHKSVDFAEKEGFSQEQGLAYELAGHLCLREGSHHDVEADLYLSQARSFYARWGAHAKVEQLAQCM